MKKNPKKSAVSITARVEMNGNVDTGAAISFEGGDTELFALWATLTNTLGQWIGMTHEQMFQIFTEEGQNDGPTD